MKQKKVLKRVLTILIIVLILILVVFWTNIVRKHLIIQDLRQKIAENRKVDNYYVKVKVDYENGMQSYIFKKGNLELVKNENDDDETIMYRYKDLENQTVNMYFINEDSKVAILRQKDESSFGESLFEDYFDIENQVDYLKFLAKVKISSKEYNGKSCYCINVDKCFEITDFGFIVLDINEIRNNEPYELYIEKETGLELYSSLLLREYEYQFDVVTDEDFIEPNISDFKVTYLTLTEEDYKKYNEEDLSLRIVGWSHGFNNLEEQYGLTFRVYEQVPDETLEGEIGRFVGKDIMFSVNLDKDMICKFGREERTLEEEFQLRQEAGTLKAYGDEEVFPLLNDELVFENGELVSIMFSPV
ncbi:MAG: hypothetical protein IJ629_05065 [Clostridia bacterium]|nr:hypothetical protein [Clostridia bacterium]